MNRKGNPDNTNYRPNRTRKRRFYGNQFTLDTETDDDNVEAGTSDEARGLSASARKLEATADDICVNYAFCYRIIEFISVYSAISDITVCEKCKERQTFGQSNNRGLGFKISVTCSCGTVLINSGPFVKNGYEINRRIVIVMRLLGVARSGINLFCGLMELCSEISQSTYDNIVKHFHESVETLFKLSCQEAVKQEIEENENQKQSPLNLQVSGDGTWKRRGFSSLYGVTSLIGYNTGKVIDLVVKGSYCQACTWFRRDEKNPDYQEHKEECPINHTGSAGKMEVDAVREMFLRSEELYGVRYGTYIGDGDAKTFKAILDSEPYGDEFTVKKSECVGHVEKRMGTRLRNIKKAAKLGGKGKLTDILIKKMTIYYGLAIRRNCNSVEDMRNAIMSTYYHMCSTDENPQHDNCPPGADSWCKWQVAQTRGEEFHHPPPLHEDVQANVLPIYKDLSREDLLERCLGGHSQNANESLNACIWRLAPKHLNCGLRILELSAYMAAGIFNSGYHFALQTLQIMGITIGRESITMVETLDARRITRQNQRSMESTKEARTTRRLEKTQELDHFHEEEGLVYGPGIAD